MYINILNYHQGTYMYVYPTFKNFQVDVEFKKMTEKGLESLDGEGVSEGTISIN